MPQNGVSGPPQLTFSRNVFPYPKSIFSPFFPIISATTDKNQGSSSEEKKREIFILEPKLWGTVQGEPGNQGTGSLVPPVRFPGTTGGTLGEPGNRFPGTTGEPQGEPHGNQGTGSREPVPWFPPYGSREPVPGSPVPGSEMTGSPKFWFQYEYFPKKKETEKVAQKIFFLRFARRDYAAPPKIKKVRMDFQHVQF